MGIFYDAAKDLLGTPTNFVGDIYVWTTAVVMLGAFVVVVFLFLAWVLRKL